MSDPENAETEGESPSLSPSQSAKRKADTEEIEVDLNAPEPPSKRARRALKKGKALPTKASSDDRDDRDLEGGDADDDGGKGDKKEKTRSEHGVWIGNLPFQLTAEELRRWLVDNAGGSITPEGISRIKLPTVRDAGRDKKEKPANKGFAYVDFTDMGGKVAAIALSESGLGGRKLLIKDANSFEGRPARPKTEETVAAAEGTSAAQSKVEQRQEKNASRKVFVGNLSFKTTQEDLERQFERCGEIEWAKLATFEDSGKCKGFGWVKFKEPEAAAWAVKGFVKIKEAVETEEDFREDEEEEEVDKAGDEKKGDGRKQFKMRKWWVNRLLGRELKLELAEDDQSRYRKRFGKDANKRVREGDDGGRRKTETAPIKVSSQDINTARLTGAVVQHTGTKVTFD